MKPIGGFFELELTNYANLYHNEAIALNSGRNALQYILAANEYNKIHIPYYTCDVILQPIKRMNIKYDFYRIDNNLLPILDNIKSNEVLLYVNYFGILNANVQRVLKKSKNVIIDNCQSFFLKHRSNINTFYSPRKFFGVPDGGFAYCTKSIKINLERDKSFLGCDHLIKRIDLGPEKSYDLFKKNDENIGKQSTLKMSLFTERLLKSINYKDALRKRNQNFLFLHRFLKDENELSYLIDVRKINGPMVYPFLKKGNSILRKKLIKHKIFVAVYWPNVYEWTSKNSWEYYLTDSLISLPIDQRYNQKEMYNIVNMIKGNN